MSTQQVNLLRWTPRVLAFTVTAFVASFALDAVDEGAGSLVTHLLPAIVLVITTWAAWRREWIGGIAFLAFAELYVATAWQHLSWLLVIALPLALGGALYLVSWRWSYRRGQA